ncbi:antibiotic biosynthesis monooxygenase family protein [Streptomyces europaeiscabiei]|uniref:antibiotic biosynthesis monooxygenase family protein n=1 Tax=Streptomyces europaeiscabiei TaxID=146819 RepID=UPI0029B77355|nr:antibiotic biosynthesis monooxygenase [Streptomyces europaeiscabiei]MDX2774136.1 antibiotic biosynthesis monooxygenase [Streptomyces europaeiscabiei]
MSDQRIAPDGAPDGAPGGAPDGAPGGARDGAFGGAPDDAAVVAPVLAHEPPYYAVVFTSTRTADQSGYGETAERMEELVKGVPGFLGMDQAHTPGGPAITVGYFRDAAAVEEWRANVEHRAAKARGRAEWYESYSLHIAKVERSHSFVRGGGEA